MEGIETTSSPRWADLPQEILHEIFVRVSSSEDYTRFGLVCKSWRSIRDRYPPPPLLVDFYINYSFEFSNLSIVNGFPSDLTPRLTLNEPYLRCVGFSCGWLTLIHLKKSSIHLVNPLSDVWINLPTLSCTFDLFGVAISNSSPTCSDFFVIGYYVFYINHKKVNMLACCKPGDEKWTDIDHLAETAEGLVFHKGRVYVVLRDGNTNVYNLNANRFNLSGQLHFPLTQRWRRQGTKLKLTESVGELLLVAKISRCQYNLTVFKVFKLEKGRWVRTRDVGDQALLLSPHGLDSICTRKTEGCGFKRNCIYELHVVSLEENELYDVVDVQHEINFVVYSLEKEEYKFRGTYHSSQYLLYTAWFIPQGW